MDDERLKEMRHFGQGYFDELLERIRDIRVSFLFSKIKRKGVFLLYSCGHLRAVQ